MWVIATIKVIAIATVVLSLLRIMTFPDHGGGRSTADGHPWSPGSQAARCKGFFNNDYESKNIEIFWFRQTWALWVQNQSSKGWSFACTGLLTAGKKCNLTNHLNTLTLVI